MVGYLIGMVTTIMIMLIFQRGQPALLYLVPGCLLSVLACAFIRKELTQIFNYDEETELNDLGKITREMVLGPQDDNNTTSSKQEADTKKASQGTTKRAKID